MLITIVNMLRVCPTTNFKPLVKSRNSNYKVNFRVIKNYPIDFCSFQIKNGLFAMHLQ